MIPLCIGERKFCEFYSFFGWECIVCINSVEAQKNIISSNSNSRMIFISESIVDSELSKIINEPGRVITVIPSIKSEFANIEDDHLMIRNIIGVTR